MSKIEKVLDLEPVDGDGNHYAVPAKIEKTKDISTDKEQIADDFDSGRDSMHELIEKGHEALDEMLMIAKQSQHPQAYSTLNSMMKTMADLHKDLLTMHEKKKSLLSDESKNKTSTTPTEVVNNTNNIFVGTTAELSKLIKDNKENNE